VNYSNGKQDVFVFESLERAKLFAESTNKILQMSDRMEPGESDGEDYPEGDR
jgi:hypothetical protein